MNTKREAGYKSLAIAIIEQAVVDYVNAGKRAKLARAEIEEFFRSEWCDCLLQALDTELDGKTILKHLAYK